MHYSDMNQVDQMRYAHLLSFLLCILITGCNHKPEPADNTSQVKNTAVKQTIVKDNTITLPGHAPMTPEQYAAWWAGVPVDLLLNQQKKIPDKSDLDKSLNFKWNITEKNDKSSKLSRKMLTLDTYSWTTMFIIMGSKTKAEPKSSKTTDVAKSMAISFLQARSFNEKELILVKENAIATDAENIPTVVSFEYHYYSNEDCLLSITVDCIQGQIKSAMFDPGIPHKFKQDFKLTKDQAKEAIIKELHKQSIVEYQIQSGRRLRGKAYREVETPMYEFIVILQKQVSAEVSPYQNWYVNGLTGEVGQADDFPEIQASLNHE